MTQEMKDLTIIDWVVIFYFGVGAGAVVAIVLGHYWLAAYLVLGYFVFLVLVVLAVLAVVAIFMADQEDWFSNYDD